MDKVGRPEVGALKDRIDSRPSHSPNENMPSEWFTGLQHRYCAWYRADREMLLPRYRGVRDFFTFFYGCGYENVMGKEHPLFLTR
jgi:hypothetical protein